MPEIILKQVWNTKTAKRVKKADQISAVESFLPVKGQQTNLPISPRTSLFDFSESKINGVFRAATLPETKLGFPKPGLHASIQESLFEKRGKQSVRNTLEANGRIIVCIRRTTLLEQLCN